MHAEKIPLEKIQQAKAGVWDKDEFLKPAKVILRKSSQKESHLLVELTEGKNREIRRLFDSLGHEVTDLKRIAFGVFKLGELQPGQFRQVSQAEIDIL